MNEMTYDKCPECKGVRFHHSRCKTRPPLAPPAEPDTGSGSPVSGVAAVKTMSVKRWDSLDRRDFDNGAILDEVRSSLKELERLQKLIPSPAPSAPSSTASLAEVRDQLSRKFPGRTISVGEAAWCHGQSGVSFESYVEYTISTCPGFDGHSTQNFGGNSLQECLNKFNHAAPRLPDITGATKGHINSPEIL